MVRSLVVGRGRLSGALILVVLALGPRAAAQPPSEIAAQPAPTGPGRVLVTVTALDSSLRIPGVDVELGWAADGVTLARTVTDGVGRVSFPDVPPGSYVVKASRGSFASTTSAPFEVRPGETAQLVLPLHLTFMETGVEVVGESPTEPPVQPVSTSDMLAGSVLDLAPMPGDDFQSLLPLLPGVVRGPDGRLRVKGGQPTQGALQISSTSLNDPSTGDFDLELPGQSLESVELLANPFSAEFGRFSTSMVQIQTQRGTNVWEVNPGNLVPRFRSGYRIRGFEPRLSVRGPLSRNRLFVAQDFQFRYVSDSVKSLPDEPGIELTSFDSFTRVDGSISPRHSLGALLVMFPRRIEHLTMNTFRPLEATPNFTQRGASIGVQDRFALSPSLVLESTLAVRNFEVEVTANGPEPMIFTPESQRGNYFNDQEREVRSVQWVEALSIAADRWRGQHLFKIGLDVQHSSYSGVSTSRPVEMRRPGGSLAELVMFGPRSVQRVSAAEVSAFAQDRWRVGSRVTLELGVRVDREDVIERVNWSPRAGVAVAVVPDGRGILRGGIGRFGQRTPLNVGAFEQFEARTVTRFDEHGAVTREPLTFLNVADADLHTPYAIAGNVEWNGRFGRRVLVKANYLRRNGSNEHILEPDHVQREIRLSSSGRSRYWEAELTGRYLGGERRDMTVSYVRSQGVADLNGYDQFYGNVRQPILRPNARAPIPTDVPHRLLVRGLVGLPGKWDVAPVLELRSGFPWSAVDEYQDFVGARNRAGRLPAVRTLDLAVTRPWQFRKYRFRAGLRIYNLFGSAGERDVQHNIRSDRFGQFFNPLDRSIGVMFGSAR